MAYQAHTNSPRVAGYDHVRQWFPNVSSCPIEGVLIIEVFTSQVNSGLTAICEDFYFQIDLKDIAETYLEKYHVGLSRAVHEDTSGDYRKLLTRLTNLPVVQPPADQLIENNSGQAQQSL